MTNVLCHKMSPFTKCPLSQNVPFHEMSSVTNCSPKQNILCHYYKINNYRNINTLQFFLLTILSTNSFSLGSLFLFSTVIVSLLLKHLPDHFFLFLETSLFLSNKMSSVSKKIYTHFHTKIFLI